LDVPEGLGLLSLVDVSKCRQEPSIPILSFDRGGMSQMGYGGRGGLTFKGGETPSLRRKTCRIAKDSVTIDPLRKTIEYLNGGDEEALITEPIYKNLLSLF